MAAIKKPTLLKMPKKPGAGASLSVMEKYVKRVEQVKKENSKRESDYKAKISKLESLKKKISKM